MSALAESRDYAMLGAPLRDVFGSAVVDLASEDPRIVLLDADVGNSTRADLFDEAHPDRYLPMGVAEQNMMGVAAGLAAVGFVPFATTFAVFAAKRALDQIRVLIAQPRVARQDRGRLYGTPHRDDRAHSPGGRGHHYHAGDAEHGRNRSHRCGRNAAGATSSR